jgi:Tfp pilus assembly protein PilF
MQSRRRLAGAALLLVLAAALAQPAGAGDATGSGALATGIELYAAGRFEEAERRFAEAAEREPASAEAHYWRGLAASRAGRHRRAVDSLERARSLDPDFPDIDLQIGIAFQRAGDSGAAAEALDRALARDPESASAHFFQGRAAQRRGQHSRAEEHLVRAAELDPELASAAWLETARSRALRGDRAGALAAIDRSLAGGGGESASAARDLRARIEAGAWPPRPWWLSGSAGLEYDDNLTVTELDVTTDQADVAGIFAVSAGGRPLERGPSRLEIDYDFFQSLYADVTDLNLRSHSVAAVASTELAGLDPSLAYRYLHATLGDDAFLDTHRVSLGIGASLAPQWYASAGYHFEDRSIAQDELRDATRLAFSLDQFLFLGERRATARLGWRIELEDARGPEFDFVGNTVVLSLRGDLPWRVLRTEARLEWEFEARDYTEETPSIGEKRADRRNTIRLGLVRPFTRHVSVVLDYQFIASSSNLPSQDFDENILALRAEAAF